MTTTIQNDTPNEIFFTLPEFYRVQANFNYPWEIHLNQYDYTSRETLDRISGDCVIAAFKIKPKKRAVLENDLYERASV